MGKYLVRDFGGVLLNASQVETLGVWLVCLESELKKIVSPTFYMVRSA